jgi:hypothetical protein
MRFKTAHRTTHHHIQIPTRQSQVKSSHIDQIARHLQFVEDLALASHQGAGPPEQGAQGPVLLREDHGGEEDGGVG